MSTCTVFKRYEGNFGIKIFVIGRLNGFLSQEMQDYKATHGTWPRNPVIILLFIVLFEIGCYYLIQPLLDALKLG